MKIMAVCMTSSMLVSGPDSCLVNNVEWGPKSVGTFMTDCHLPSTHSDWQPPVIGQALVQFDPHSKIHPSTCAASCIASRWLPGRLNSSLSHYRRQYVESPELII